MEEVGATSTSRLLVLLLREREREELENQERKESAFTLVRNSLSRKFSFRKVKVETRKETLKEEKQFHKKIFFKLTNTFRKSVKKSSPEKKLEEEEEEEEEDNLPSGRDSAYFSQSKSLSETHKHSEAANNTIECSSSSSSITSSRCSSLTTNPILPNTSEKKKSVTIHLPNAHARGRPFGFHLRIQNTKLINLPQENSYNRGNAFYQVRKIKDDAKQDLLEQFPSITTTINHLFMDNPKALLMSLSSSKIGDLIFHLRTLLFSPLLPMIKTLDIILFQIIKFLQAVILNLNCAEHKGLQTELEEIYQNYSNTDCLQHIKSIFIILWISVLLKD